MVSAFPHTLIIQQYCSGTLEIPGVEEVWGRTADNLMADTEMAQEAAKATAAAAAVLAEEKLAYALGLAKGAS